MPFAQVHSGPDVFEVKVPFANVSTSATNCFVVMDGGEALVVDTGAPTDEDAAVLDASLDELGIDRARATPRATRGTPWSRRCSIPAACARRSSRRATRWPSDASASG